ncbi:MAG TPA: acetate--CoA ligase family protein, partial [Anaerolineaceae bacterium]|nr:acetate--CoA ligase family protein [Anaerolineaceae bacterium]
SPPGVLAADRAEELGLQVSEPSEAVKAELRQFLPAHCSLRNPIDLTVEGTEAGYRRTLIAVLGEYDAAVAINVSTPYLDSLSLARGVADAAKALGKPVLANFIPNQVVGESVAYLKENGVPNYPSGERAVETLAMMARYAGAEAPRGSLAERTQTLTEQALRLPVHGQMLEPVAMAWLRQNGISTPNFSWAQEPDDAVKAARAIGYPVVVKVVSRDILHKSDVGGVVVGVRDDDELRQAFDRMRLAAQGKDFSGVVIYPVVRNGVEALVGLTRDPQFGPVVAFGLGGIYTEIWRDFALRVAPIDLAEAERMIREIKGFRLLQGARGSKPRDLKALAELLVKVSELPLKYAEIQEADLNPVFLLEEGLVVGDVRVIRE